MRKVGYLELLTQQNFEISIPISTGIHSRKWDVIHILESFGPYRFSNKLSSQK
jgi:hypothetical protein